MRQNKLLIIINLYFSDKVFKGQCLRNKHQISSETFSMTFSSDSHVSRAGNATAIASGNNGI